MTRPGVREVFARIGLLTVVLTAGFALLEISARLWLLNLATPEQFAAYASVDQIEARPARGRKLAPHRHLGWIATPGYRRGRNHHNSLGFRGDEIAVPKDEGVFRIVCLGGSTTYCPTVEDPDQAYPALLEKALREAGYPKVEVVNGGVPGYGSLETLIHLELRVLDLEPDLLIVSHAVNDVHARLVWPPSAHRGDNSGSTGPRGLAPMASVLEHSTALRTMLVRLGRAAPHGSLERAFGPALESHFTRRFHAQVLDGSYPAGPFRDVSIAEMLERNPPRYLERNLGNLVTLARARGVEVVLATFPYHPGWTGKSPIAYPAYRDGIAESNRVTLQVAAATGALGFDLASRVPPEKRYFTDGYHFTEEGNELRARLLGDLIVDSGLLQKLQPPLPLSSPHEQER